jgi:hypothetical protein
VLWVATGVAVPEQAQPFVEAAAALLLVWLGVDLLRTRGGARARIAARTSTAAAPCTRTCTGAHRVKSPHTWVECLAPLAHPHAHHPLRRAVLVGSLHGLGGSALLGLLAVRGADASRAIAYAAVFGLGATAGMLALSTTISLPLRSPGVRAAALGHSSRRAGGDGVDRDRRVDRRARAASGRSVAVRNLMKSARSRLTAARDEVHDQE